MSEAAAYEAIATGAGLIDRGDRSRIEVAGPDRAKFLHNLTTSDVKRLAAGHGQETFVTSLQGKTLGYATLLGCDDRILLRTDPGGLASVLPHLQKYGVFDDVTLTDVAATTFEYHLAGPEAEALVGRAGADVPAEGDLRHVTTRVAGVAVRVIREAPTGRPGLSLIGEADGSADVLARLRLEGKGVGMVDVGPELYDVLRIEAGTPAFGRDVTPDNLPQEVGRDDRAISFVKGCYLGQETVARIDALGHVNKLLKGLRLRGPGSRPLAGARLMADGKTLGTVTSSAFSPGWGTMVALGYVRSAQAVAGTEVSIVDGDESRPAIVCDLPMMPPSPA